MPATITSCGQPARSSISARRGLPEASTSFSRGSFMTCCGRVCVFQSASARANMNQLIKSLPNVLRAAGDSAEVAEAAAMAAWKHAAGEGLKGRAVPVKLKEGTLTVSVADAIWQKQLHSMRGQLLFRVNSILGQPIVGAIEFVIDPKLSARLADQQKE